METAQKSTELGNRTYFQGTAGSSTEMKGTYRDRGGEMRLERKDKPNKAPCGLRG